MYTYFNPNPQHKRVGDCVIRAVSKALDKTWDEVYIDLALAAFQAADMPSANHVWANIWKRTAIRKKYWKTNARIATRWKIFVRNTAEDILY